MSRIFKKIWKNNLWIFFLIITILFLPSSLSLHAQTNDRSIAIAIGIDKLAEQKYELSAEIVVPRYETTYNQNAQVISAIGANPTEAFNELSTHLGKILGLSHCSAVVLGQSVEDDNLINLIDMVLRGKRVNYNAQLIFTDGSAKEVLKKAVEVDGSFIQNLNGIVQFNNNFIYTKTSLVSNLYKTYCDGYGASFIPLINLSNNEYDGLSGSSGSSNASSGGENGSQGGSSEGGSTSQDSNQYLSNDGQTALIKNGKYITTFSSEQMKGFGLITNESNRGLLTIEHVTDDFLTDADVIVSIRSRSITPIVKFSKTGVPQIYYTCNYTLKVEDISNGAYNPNIVDSSRNYFSKEFCSRFVSKVKSYCADAINLSKEYGADTFGIYELFDRFEHENWQNYLKNLLNSENYIKNVEFFMEIKVKDTD